MCEAYRFGAVRSEAAAPIQAEGMNHELLREIDQAEIDAFDRDGVVLLPGLFDPEWISLLLLRRGVRAVTRQPILDSVAPGRALLVGGRSQHLQHLDATGARCRSQRALVRSRIASGDRCP